MLYNNSLTAIDQLDKSDIESVIAEAQKYVKDGYPHTALQGKVIGSLFFETSTRTRLSFEAAAQRLGAGVIGFSGTDSTSMSKKGESFEDTIRMVNGYVDCIVMRHPDAGAAQRAAEVATVPVINAGDGPNEHPTQTLLDMYAVHETQGALDNLTIALVGDLKFGRVPHSFAKAMTHWPSTKQIWVAPDSLAMPSNIEQFVKDAGVDVHITTNLQEVIDDVDILMMTRVQVERFDDPKEYEKVKDVYILSNKLLKEAKSNMKILHPLPRRYEIPEEIDASPHAYYFQQAANGAFVRAALLNQVLNNG